jgi:hypothetical protein
VNAIVLDVVKRNVLCLMFSEGPSCIGLGSGSGSGSRLELDMTRCGKGKGRVRRRVIHDAPALALMDCSDQQPTEDEWFFEVHAFIKTCAKTKPKLQTQP